MKILIYKSEIYLYIHILSLTKRNKWLASGYITAFTFSQSHASLKKKGKMEKWLYSSVRGKWMGGDLENQIMDAQTKRVNRSVNEISDRQAGWKKALSPRRDWTWVSPGEDTSGWLHWCKDTRRAEPHTMKQRGPILSNVLLFPVQPPPPNPAPPCLRTW